MCNLLYIKTIIYLIPLTSYHYYVLQLLEHSLKSLTEQENRTNIHYLKTSNHCLSQSIGMTKMCQIKTNE